MPDDLAAQLAELRGAVVARLDDGSDRMGRIDGKIDRVLDGQEAMRAQLADHESRIRSLEGDRRDDRQAGRDDRRASDATMAGRITAALSLVWSSALTWWVLRHR